MTGTTLIFLKTAGIEYNGNPAPQGEDQKVKRVIAAILICGFIGAGAYPAQAGEKGARVCNRNDEYEMKVEGNQGTGQELQDQVQPRGKRSRATPGTGKIETKI